MASRTILVLMAHPDDAELSCAGTVARWTRTGATAVLVIATDGARGAKLQGVDGMEIARERSREQAEAALVIGFKDIVHLGFPDGDLDDGPAIRAALVEQIRRLRPQTVIMLDPLTIIYRDSYVNHRDHRILGMAMLDAMYPEASNAGYFPEQLSQGLGLHKVPELLLANSEQPNYWIDVSETLDLRFDALRCHRSQMRLWPDGGEAVIQQQREYAAVLGVEHGVRYVEAFRRVVVNPLA